MSKIVSIGTAVPEHQHSQQDILGFMQRIYARDEAEQRKLQRLYRASAIETRHSTIGDFSRPDAEWDFYPPQGGHDAFPSIERRMQHYEKHAAQLSMASARACMAGQVQAQDITHLITVSCTGMSAPGLDLQLAALLGLPTTVHRTSVNFMGCYAAIHGLKMADAICKAEPQARVLLVCTELCTLHFQQEPSGDNIASSLLFADGSAAALLTHDSHPAPGLRLDSFYSEIVPNGREHMSWRLSSTGFLMTLSGYIPDLIDEDFEGLVDRALQKAGQPRESVGHWCIHPGGRKILEVIARKMGLAGPALDDSYQVLREYGNMSSATLLFVLKRKLAALLGGERQPGGNQVFGAAFGPGLTMETFSASVA